MVDDLRILQRAAEILREDFRLESPRRPCPRGRPHEPAPDLRSARGVDREGPGPHPAWAHAARGSDRFDSECNMHPAEGCFVRRPDFADPGATTFSLYRPGPGARDRQGGAPGASSSTPARPPRSLPSRAGSFQTSRVKREGGSLWSSTTQASRKRLIRDVDGSNMTPMVAADRAHRRARFEPCRLDRVQLHQHASRPARPAPALGPTTLGPDPLRKRPPPRSRRRRAPWPNPWRGLASAFSPRRSRRAHLARESARTPHGGTPKAAAAQRGRGRLPWGAVVGGSGARAGERRTRRRPRSDKHVLERPQGLEPSSFRPGEPGGEPDRGGCRKQE